jgi:hypothetical protein
MWVLVLLLDLMGPKKFVRFLAGWVVITLFFLYCFVHDAFDHPRPGLRSMISQTGRRSVIRPLFSIPSDH